MIDQIIIWIGKKGYLLALVILFIKWIHFRNYPNQSLAKFFLFAETTISSTGKLKTKQFKLLQNGLSLTILVILLLQLMVYLTVLLPAENINNTIPTAPNENQSQS